MSYSTIKTFIYDYSFSDILNTNANKRYEIFGKPKKILICNYGVHSKNNLLNDLVEIDLGNFLPNTEKLYCHITNGNNFLVHTSLEFDADLSQYNGNFKPVVVNVDTDQIINDDIILVLQLNLIY